MRQKALGPEAFLQVKGEIWAQKKQLRGMSYHVNVKISLVLFGNDGRAQEHCVGLPGADIYLLCVFLKRLGKKTKLFFVEWGSLLYKSPRWNIIYCGFSSPVDIPNDLLYFFLPNTKAKMIFSAEVYPQTEEMWLPTLAPLALDGLWITSAHIPVVRPRSQVPPQQNPCRRGKEYDLFMRCYLVFFLGQEYRYDSHPTSFTLSFPMLS